MTAPPPPLAHPAGRLFRVAPSIEVWNWPPPKVGGNNRWDDPMGRFRTLYAAESPYGCYVELLAQFRPDLELLAELNAVRIDPIDAEDPRILSNQPGLIPSSWPATRWLGEAFVTGEYLDVRTAETIAHLRREVGHMVRELGLADFDAAALKLSKPRQLSQLIAAWAWSRSSWIGLNEYAGVAFASRHGDEIALWAIFERPDSDYGGSSLLVVPTNVARVDPGSDDFARAMRLHDLRWLDP